MKSIYGLAVLLGAATGIRSTAGFAILATSDAAPRSSPFRSSAVRAVLLTAVAAETVADKVAHLPARTEPLPLGGRIVLGSAVAGIAARWSGRHPLASALIGGGAAAATAWAATAVRSVVARRNLPDEWPALAEDATAAALGKAAHVELTSDRGRR